MRRGDIVIVSLDPVLGSEASKTRPAVVVSNDAANATAARLGRGAQAEQIRSVAVQRIGERVGRLPAALMSELDQALRVHLGL
jgi:mRNA interferase MazF